MGNRSNLRIKISLSFRLEATTTITMCISIDNIKFITSESMVNGVGSTSSFIISETINIRNVSGIELQITNQATLG